MNIVKEMRLPIEKLNWFSGLNEQERQAKNIITSLLDDLKTGLGNESLKKVLENYFRELEQNDFSNSLLLERMNLDISKSLRNDNPTLSDQQSKKLKKLLSISNFKYG